MKNEFVKTGDGNKVVNPYQTIDDAIKALRAWSRYGEEMKAIGRGAECTRDAVGMNTEYLVSLLEKVRDLE